MFIAETPLSVAGNAFSIIGIAVAAITACRVDLPLDLVPGHEVPPMHRIPVGPIPEFDRRFDLHHLGVAIGTERLRMADCANLGISPSRIFVLVKKIGRVVVYGIRFSGSLELVVKMAVGTERLPFGEWFYMPGGKRRLHENLAAPHNK